MNTTMPRATREDWLVAALELLTTQGPQMLTLERVCRAMGKSKGSFYHHFEDMPTLRGALLDRWERRQTDAFIEAAEQADDRTRAQVLDELATQADWGEERAVRAWAWRDPEVRERVDAVDRKRIEYLAALQHDLDPSAAQRIALLEYAALVGAMHLFITDDPATRSPEIGAFLRNALRAASHNESP